MNINVFEYKTFRYKISQKLLQFIYFLFQTMFNTFVMANVKTSIGNEVNGVSRSS